MDRKDERDALHGPWPTQPEELSAQYADRWVIYRDLRPDGTHGDWMAVPRHLTDDAVEPISAGSIEILAEKLAAAER